MEAKLFLGDEGETFKFDTTNFAYSDTNRSAFRMIKEQLPANNSNDDDDMTN